MTTLKADSSSYQTSADNFKKTCKSLLDMHAPEITKTINDIPEAPWFDGEYKLARIDRRKAEKKWRKTNLDIDHSIYTNLRLHCDELSLQKKKRFFKDNFTKYQHSQKSLYKFVDTFLDQDGNLTLPSSSEDLQNTVNSFNNFFTQENNKFCKLFYFLLY